MNIHLTAKGTDIKFSYGHKKYPRMLARINAGRKIWGNVDTNTL
jgi:hypothetical protein